MIFVITGHPGFPIAAFSASLRAWCVLGRSAAPRFLFAICVVGVGRVFQNKSHARFARSWWLFGWLLNWNYFIGC